MGDTEAEGAARERRSARGGEEEDELISRIYHSTVLLGKLYVGQPTGKGEGVCSRMTYAPRPGYRLQRFSGRNTCTQ